MASYYECHITIKALPEAKDFVQSSVEKLKWKFSCIDGDPVLGAGMKMYATKQMKGTERQTVVLEDLEDTADALRHWDIDVVREKIERVIYDSRSSKVKFT
jgi:hypothetical protein